MIFLIIFFFLFVVDSSPVAMAVPCAASSVRSWSSLIRSFDAPTSIDAEFRLPSRGTSLPFLSSVGRYGPNRREGLSGFKRRAKFDKFDGVAPSEDAEEDFFAGNLDGMTAFEVVEEDDRLAVEEFEFGMFLCFVVM